MAKSRKSLSKTDLRYTREFKSRSLGRDQLARWGAHSMGIGRKMVKGKATSKVCVRIYVEKKQELKNINKEQQIPTYFNFKPGKSSRLFKVITDVIEEPMAHFEPIDPETMIRPAPGGVSGGLVGSTGTIGGYVWDNTDDSIVMISNEHVFGTATGTTIIQQGSADGGSSPAQDFGEVKRGIPRIPGGAINIVDASIGDPDDENDIDLSVIDIGPAVYAIDEAVVEMLVEKYGQTTRHTYGQVTDQDWEGWVSGFYFEQCFRVDNRPPSTDWSAGGDSGSLVFSQQTIDTDSDIKPVVGLHFAGASTYGIACHIQNVFTQLDLTTLCSGAFSSFLDSLFSSESESESEREKSMRATFPLAIRQPVVRLPKTLLAKNRDRLSSRNFYSGISRDIQKQLTGSTQGRKLVDLIDTHRHSLLTMLMKDGDIRRLTVHTVGTMAKGKITSRGFLDRKLSGQDIENLDRLASEVSRKSSRKLKAAIAGLRPLLKKAKGRSIASILSIK